MANTIIPKKFNKKLSNNQQLEGLLKSTLDTYGEILTENKLYFFPEYTDHGIRHIENILASSNNLITDQTFGDILTEKDITFYTLSVLLHDIGMHIDLNGFNLLLEGTFEHVRVEYFDNITWNELWKDYLNEAKKFSGKQLQNIFGRDNVVVRIPPLDNPGEINENDKKLIGEFIRRHHARLAHEIALYGFPAKPNTIPFCSSLEETDKSLIGVIARSHGLPLRTSIDFIENYFGKENKRFPRGIHAGYLMVLLRLADYVQIENDRSSKVLIKSKTFESPVSKLEHEAHIAIDNVDYKWQDDPERIFVNASPKSSTIFLKLQKLFKDIQIEFDIAWAVLGELYGNLDSKLRPEIKYRRINSNLNNKDFTNKLNYVADQFLFKPNDDIIKLLVAPLYGDNVTYGVRELLQNAIDACRERELIDVKNSIDYFAQVDLKVEKENDNHYFTITDNGLGMDLEIIKNYFLSAGASFRTSLEWKKEFVDEKGNSKVARSGRFGVGILSAFLIGNRIDVTTRKVNCKVGYRFEASLNTELINILKDRSIQEGTSIKIQIDGTKLENFLKQESSGHVSWTKWYNLKYPKVGYTLMGKRVKSFSSFGPDYRENIPLDWEAIDSEGYNKILWTYNNKFRETSFTCNGIVIPNTHRSHFGFLLSLREPTVSVFDSNGLLPLTLDRNGIAGRLSFEDELLQDIYKDLIAYLLVKNDVPVVNGNKILLKNSKVNHPSLRNYYSENSAEIPYGINTYQGYVARELLNSIYVSKNGFILNYCYFLRKISELEVVFMQMDTFPIDEIKLDLKGKFLFASENKINSIDDYKYAIEANNFDSKTERFLAMNARFFIKTEKFHYLFRSGKKRVSNWLNSQCVRQNEVNGLTCFFIDKPTESVISSEFLSLYGQNVHFIREHTLSCKSEGDPILNKLFEKYIGNNPVIPFDLEKRKELYPLAFKELVHYMEKYKTNDLPKLVRSNFNYK